MEDGADSPPTAKPPPSGGRRLPGRTPSGLLGKPGTLQLNQSTTPQQQALPVKRRGSFQQLKKAGSHAGRDGASSHLDSDSSPSIFAVVKKSTHWEKYGTVLVLLVADELSSDREAVLQMLSAEGYDDHTTDNVAEALKLFSEKEVYPDIVIIDSDHELVDTRQVIKQLQNLNPTVAVLVLGSKGGPLTAVQALQSGAADYMYKPLNLDELVARVERHVQRQHCIKLEMEKALEDAKQMMQQLMPASLLGDVMRRKDGAPCGPGQKGGAGAGGLNSVAETDFEDQMSELSEENHRLGQKVQEMERKLELKDNENRALEAKLNAIDRRVAELASRSEGGSGLLGALGGQIRGQLDSVTQANLDLRHKVDELERLLHSQTAAAVSHTQPPPPPPVVAAAAPAAPPPAHEVSWRCGNHDAQKGGTAVTECAAAAVAAAAAGQREEPPAPQQHLQQQPAELRESTSGFGLLTASALGGFGATNAATAGNGGGCDAAAADAAAAAAVVCDGAGPDAAVRMSLCLSQHPLAAHPLSDGTDETSANSGGSEGSATVTATAEAEAEVATGGGDGAEGESAATGGNGAAGAVGAEEEAPAWQI